MKFFVNENCIGCGLCPDTCPEVFSMTDDGVARAIDEDAPDEHEVSALEAMENCPVDAIEKR